MKDTYVQALLELLQTSDDTTVTLEGFRRTLESRGHLQLQTPVLQAVLRVLEAKRPDTLVVVANDTDREKQRTVIEAALSALGTSLEHAVTAIDETIVGGYIVEHNTVRTDASYKTALAKLYRNLTTN